MIDQNSHAIQRDRFSEMEVSRIHHPDGSRRVYGRVDGGFNSGQFRACGWLMATLPDSRQQPKSLTHKLLERRLTS